MRREWIWPVVVVGCIAMLVTNRQQFAEQMRELRAEMAGLREKTAPPAQLPALPPEDPATQVPPEMGPNPQAAEIADFRQIFRANLEAQLVSEEQTDETRAMIRDALRGPR